MTEPARAKVLIFAIGNPSRGDDALGSLLGEAIDARLASLVVAGRLEVLTDFQLQVEHTLDIHGRDIVVFVDAMLAAEAATVDTGPSFRFDACVAADDKSAFSHAMSRPAILRAYESLYGPAPNAWTLGMFGTEFELGAPLSDVSHRALEEATEFLVTKISGWCR